MRICEFSNSVTTPSGYGIVSKHLLYRWARHHDVCQCAYYGQEGSAEFKVAWPFTNPIWIFPKNFHGWGKDALEMVVENWKPDLVVSLMDLWPTQEPDGRSFLSKLKARWVAYCPQDHEEPPAPMINLAASAWKVVAMSEFGHRTMEKYGLHSVTIPHGVDTKLYFPMAKTEARQKWNIRPDAFVVGHVGANKGNRKDFPRMVQAFRTFLDQNPDAKRDACLYLHAWTEFPPEMHFNLKALAQRFGIGANVLFTVPWNLYRGLREDEMNIIYNCMDVYFTLSRHEGFALPVLEAQACGVPVIASTLTSHVELVEKTGWLVKPAVKDLSPMLEFETVSDEFHAAELLGKAYNSREELQKTGRNAREFALGYDYDKLVAEKWLPFFRECEEEIRI